MRRLTTFCLTALITGSISFTAFAQETATAPKQESKQPATEKKADDKKAEPASFPVLVADDKIKFVATGNWKKVAPRNRIVEAEIKVPKVGEDPRDGRLTIMGAGGTIEANIERWQKQFTQPDGSSSEDKTKIDKMKVGENSVSLVSITGTYIDAPGGPFSGTPKINRPNYRMLAAIIQTKANGNYFVKLYGPKPTIDKNEEHFKKMVKSITITK